MTERQTQRRADLLARMNEPIADILRREIEQSRSTMKGEQQ